MYPFRYKIGDEVQVVDGIPTHGGRVGTIKALELNGRNTQALVVCGKSMIRQLESNLLPANRPSMPSFGLPETA